MYYEGDMVGWFKLISIPNMSWERILPIGFFDFMDKIIDKI